MNHNDFNQEEDEKFFTEFKEKMAIDPLSDTVRHIEKQASKRQMLTILILVVMASAAGICWNMYSSYISTKEPATEILALQPDIAPEKVRPENPGGLLIPNQDKTVYNRLSSSDKPQNEDIVISETLTPDSYFSSNDTPAEEAASENVTVIYEPAKRTQETAQASDNGSGEVVEQITYKSLFASPEQKSEAAQENNNFAKLDQVMAEKENAAALENLVESTIKTAESKKTSEAAKTPQKPKELVKPAVKTEQPKVKSNGDWRVQLLSSGEEKAVVASWERIKKKHSSVLNGYDYEIVSAVVHDKTIYRLRIKSFESSASAAELCNKLKAAKQDCMVIKK